MLKFDGLIGAEVCTILFISIHFHYFIFDSVLFSQRRISVNLVDLVKSFKRGADRPGRRTVEAGGAA